MFIQRQQFLTQLLLITQSVSDLKKFQLMGPPTMLNLRKLAIKLVGLIKRHHHMKNKQYVDLMKQALPPCSIKNSEYFFEMEFGHCNILDLVREGKFIKLDQQPSGAAKTQFVQVETFLLEKLSTFLADDKVMFLPNADEALSKQVGNLKGVSRQTLASSLQRLNPNELPIFENIVSQLKPKNKKEEDKINEALKFIMDNS